MRDYSRDELLAMTAGDMLAGDVNLCVHCETCRSMRQLFLPRLAAARPTQPVSAMVFRCGRHGTPGGVHLSWRGPENQHRSFKIPAKNLAKPVRAA